MPGGITQLRIGSESWMAHQNHKSPLSYPSALAHIQEALTHSVPPCPEWEGHTENQLLLPLEGAVQVQPTLSGIAILIRAAHAQLG